MKMKNFFRVVISITVVYSFLITYGPSASAFVTPEHYAKIKQQAREKDKNQENPIQSAPPGKFQVHQPGEGQAPLRKLNQK
jgi:hypothetical protein